MRLEDVSVGNVASLSSSELKDLRHRAEQLWRAASNWRDSLAAGKVGVVKSIGRRELLETYQVISAELAKRGEEWPLGELDRKLARKRLRGVDVEELPSIVIRPAAVSLAGAYVAGPRSARTVDVRVDSDQFGDEISFEIEKRVAELVAAETGLPAVVRRDAEGMEPPVLPLYDLVLLPRKKTADLSDEEVAELAKRLGQRDDSLSDDAQEPKEDEAHEEPEEEETSLPPVTFVSKPYPREHAARQLDPKQFDDFRRENNKFGQGIHAIWGIKNGKAKLQSIRFDANKFTPAKARAWLKEHGYKTSLEEATKPKKAATSFIKSEEERIVAGPVYGLGSPRKVDGQGDFVDDIKELWKALKDWRIRSKGRMKIMHQGSPVDLVVIECFLAETDTLKSGHKVRKGDWYLSVYVPEKYEELWQAIKDGEITGFSLAGTASAELV